MPVNLWVLNEGGNCKVAEGCKGFHPSSVNVCQPRVLGATKSLGSGGGTHLAFFVFPMTTDKYKWQITDCQVEIKLSPHSCDVFPHTLAFKQCTCVHSSFGFSNEFIPQTRQVQTHFHSFSLIFPLKISNSNSCAMFYYVLSLRNMFFAMFWVWDFFSGARF